MDLIHEFEGRTTSSRLFHSVASEDIALEVVGTVDMPYPIYIVKGHGSRVIDIDGNDYIDLTMGFGCHVLGHAHPVVVEAVDEQIKLGLQFGIHSIHQHPLARLLIDASPCAEQVMFCNSGTEATLYAIRAARAFSEKSGLAMFQGSYHGAHDSVLMSPDRNHKEDTRAAPVGGGIPLSLVEHTHILPYLDESAFDIIRANADKLAAVIIEPIQGSNPTLAVGEFLSKLQQVCKELSVILIFDEVITGFRVAYGGGQELFDVTPDLATYGKALGGGAPIGAVAGRQDIMQCFNWNSDRNAATKIFTGGTFGGNPLSMVAGRAQVEYLRDNQEIYETLACHGQKISDEIGVFADNKGLPIKVTTANSMIRLHFDDNESFAVPGVDGPSLTVEKEFYLRLALDGILIPGDHLALTSIAHSADDIDEVISKIKSALLDTKWD